MDSVLNDIESVRKKFEELDSELNTFLEAIKEMNEIKGSIAGLPEKIKKHEADLEDRNREIEKLIAATSDSVLGFEEKSKGLLFDLEKRTELLSSNVKPGSSEPGPSLDAAVTEFGDEQKAKLDHITNSYEQMQSIVENYRDLLDSHEEAIHVLKNRHDDIIKTLEKLNIAVVEMNITASDLPVRPLDIDDKLNAMEKKLREDFFTKLTSQKNTILAVLVLLIAWIISFFYFFKY